MLDEIEWTKLECKNEAFLNLFKASSVMVADYIIAYDSQIMIHKCYHNTGMIIGHERQSVLQPDDAFKVSGQSIRMATMLSALR